MMVKQALEKLAPMDLKNWELSQGNLKVFVKMILNNCSFKIYLYIGLIKR